jgi:RNA ligase (TIGR02306 family)
MRKLASIQTIAAIEPIPGADAIEKVQILGWWLVAKKGEHRVGDRVVYCEIDSLLPEQPAFEFLRASSYKPAQTNVAGEVVLRAGFRIKTIRLRGQVSQGICFPLSILPPGTPSDVGTDVTDALGICKWEPPMPTQLKGRVRGPFPGFLPKTDETRVQVLPDVLLRHRGKRFYLTEKLDGTSFTAFHRQGAFGVCSRNLWLDETDTSNVLIQLAQQLRLADQLAALAQELGHAVAIQGEVLGPGIQGNKYALKGLQLRVFNVLNVDTHRLLDLDAMQAALAKINLEMVPLLGLLTLEQSVDELIALAEGESVLRPGVPREGIVLRPLCEEQDETIGGRLSFKAINPRFLIKYDE